MKNHDKIEQETEKKFQQKDWKKRKRMKVSGKHVFKLQEIINKNPPKQKNN